MSAARKVTRRWTGCVIVLVLHAITVRAATIRIALSLTTEVDATGVHATVDVRNQGDAPVFSVTPIVSFRGHQYIAPATPSVDPAATVRQDVFIPSGTGSPARGSWPLVVRLAYTDAVFRPVEALHVTSVPLNVVPTDRLRIQVTSTTLKSVGTIRATLESSERIAARVTFFTPSGVEVMSSPVVLQLAPNERGVATATIRGVAVAPGSRVPVFAVAEFNDREEHHAVVAGGSIEIREPYMVMTRTHRWLAGAGLVLLAGAWIVAATVRGRRGI